MANNATLLISTDALGETRRNAYQFVDHLAIAIGNVAAGQPPTGFAVGCHVIPAQVITFHHADNTSIIAVGGYRGVPLAELPGSSWATTRDLAIDAIRELMKTHRISRSDL
jgi:hypothetical protein